MLINHEVTIDDVRTAAGRIGTYVHRTPVLTSHTLNEMVGATMFFKCENFQRIGAFKARGAHNAVFSLTPEQLKCGVVTHSSGNHAAALALAARNAGTIAHVIMPSNAPTPKVASVQRLGGRITECEPTLAARESTTTQVQHATGATLVHPFDNWDVIAGQGTAALELVDQVREIDRQGLDAIMAPVGGGGLLGGTSVVGRHLGIAVFGAEPAGADDAHRSLECGRIIPADHVNTIADGLRTSLGERSFQLIQKNVSAIPTVSEESIVNAMLLVWQVLKIIIEPSCAVPVAALLDGFEPARGKRIGVILSGGNVDLHALPWL